MNIWPNLNLGLDKRKQNFQEYSKTLRLSFLLRLNTVLNCKHAEMQSIQLMAFEMFHESNKIKYLLVHQLPL